MGENCGAGVTTASQNVLLGDNSFTTLTTGNNNICIGDNARGDGSGNTGAIIIATYGGVGKGSNTGFIGPNGGAVYQGNNSSSWSTTSDRRIKKNIEDNNVGLDAITQVRVRNFEYRTLDEITDWSGDERESAHVDKQGVQVGVIAKKYKKFCRT